MSSATGGRDPGATDRAFDDHRRRQRRDALALTPAQRLRWLEETMAEMQGLLGRARDGLGKALVPVSSPAAERESAGDSGAEASPPDPSVPSR